MGPGSQVPRCLARREAERTSAGCRARGVPAPRPHHAAMFTVNVSSSMSYRGQPPPSPARQQRGHGSKCEQRYREGRRHGERSCSQLGGSGRAGCPSVCLSVCLSVSCASDSTAESCACRLPRPLFRFCSHLELSFGNSYRIRPSLRSLAGMCLEPSSLQRGTDPGLRWLGQRGKDQQARRALISLWLLGPILLF